MAISRISQRHKSEFLSLDKILAYYTDPKLFATRALEASPISQTTSPLDESLLPLPLSVNTDVPPAKKAEVTSHHNSLVVRPSTLIDATDSRSRLYFDALGREKWIDAIFAGKEIPFGGKDSRYAWRLERRVSEKAHFSPHCSYATAVYECSQSKGKVHGPKAFVKVYMQIPYYDDSSREICQRPSKIPAWIMNEIAALRQLSREKRDISTPRLLAVKRKAQAHSMWVPGGFITCIVTQRLPGTILEENTYWNLPANTRDAVRMSLRKGLESLWQAGVMPRNCGIERLAWDQVTRRCYIIDLEGAEVVHHSLRWWDYEYFRWGLSKTSFGSWETSPYVDSDYPIDIFDSKIKITILKEAAKHTLLREWNRREEVVKLGLAV